MKTVKLKDEVVEFIKTTSSIVNTKDGNYYYVPFWFKEVENNVFEFLNFDELPQDLKDDIIEKREAQPQKDNSELHFSYPDVKQ